MDRPEPLKLSSGNLELHLEPGIGGSISGFTFSADGEVWPIFRPAPKNEPSVLEMSSFPLVPWVNRVRDGMFMFRGQQVRLSPDPSIDPSPLHGHGWLGAWTVESAEATAASLGFRYPGGEWPWTYSARQDFTLDPAGISITLECTNESEEPMPCGLGHHPYFLCGPDTRLDTQVACAWTIDERVLPVEKVPAQGRFSLSNRQICAQDLDHGFGGWGGRASISDPAWPFRVEFSSPTAGFFQVYSPASGGFFVAEPVTHANAAMNAPEEEWPELGMAVLDPGRTMTLETRFDVIAG
jgi:aldose 1-epimerase